MKHYRDDAATLDDPRRGLPYRPCVGIVLLNRDGLVFLGRRRGTGGPEGAAGAYAWQLPQGGIDPGEAPLDAALRELHEETNVRSASLVAEHPEWLTYDLPIQRASRAWRGRYRGQTQRWFALRFTGDEGEIDVLNPGGGAHRPEFDAWRWERLADVPALAIPFKREVYDAVAAGFRDVAA